MTVVHPELEAEQAYVDRAYDLLDRGLADAEYQLGQALPPNRAAAQAMRRALRILKESRGTGQLVLGRVDLEHGPLYVGRRRVHDEDKNLVVVSWHAPAAQVFHEATPQDPCGVRLKRVFVEEDRRLKRIIDEITAATAAAAVEGDSAGAAISDALLAELDRTRDGAMRDVVATIQREQFRIIRADPESTVVVQGGPGTGKTVVGLHRAAWLAFNRDDLRRQGMLVVAPNPAVLSYVSGVLPSLDAPDIQQIDLASLYAGEARQGRVEDPETGRVKGSAEMAAVLRRAIASRVGWPDEDLVLSLGAARVTVPAADIQRLVEGTRRRALPHTRARDVLRQSLSSLAYERYREAQRAAGRPAVANEATIRRLSAFTNALDRMWPTFTAEALLRSLYGTQSWLVDAAEGILTADDRARLYRPTQLSIVDEPWSADDLFCLDELSYLLDGDVMKYGHVVVDEAQDLSPMQARALGRRCPTGSFTLLGDLAQATGNWVRDSWDELTMHLTAAEVQVESLTIGYRVPAPVLELAARQLPLISPGLVAPRSVRAGLGDPVVARTTDEELVRDALLAASAAVEEGLTTALIVPDERFADVLALCDEREIAAGDGRDGEFSRPLTVVPASLAKGLEFDSVVLLAPDEIVATGPRGRRELYIAMTRCTQQLRIVHAALLPAGLDHLDAPEPDVAPALDTRVPMAREPRREEVDLAADRLDDLIGLLNSADRAMVEQLVRRLLMPGMHVASAPDNMTEAGE